MRTRIPRSALAFLILILLLINGFLFASLYAERPQVLTVAFLSVGQGDAIYIKGPTGIDVLIDGGKDRSVLRQLPQVMSPLDRSLDVLIATHPDADHIGGLPGVLARYRVGTIFESGKEADTSQDAQLEDAIRREGGATYVLARQGMRIHLGEGAYADVLYPEDNVTQLRDTNDASVVVRVVYRESEFMLTGDAPSWVEERLVARYGQGLASDVLKAGHHGSRTSSSERFLAAVAPRTVVISAGKDNSYGHPHPEVLQNIQEVGATVVSTADSGTIVFRSDGKDIERVR